MANPITSKESILKVAREIVSKEGLKALNIRKIAKECDIAIGSVYYYFPSKDELMIEVIESVWEDIFRIEEMDSEDISFVDFIEKIFNHTEEGIKKYPNFFSIHSITFKAQNMNKAKDSMAKFIDKFKENLLISIERDESINQNAFNSDFTKEQLIEFILSALLSLVLQQNYGTKTLTYMIKKTIY